jgi:hypothetical protein
VRGSILAAALLLTACGSMTSPTDGQAPHWPIVYQQNFLGPRALAEFAFTDAARWEWHQQGEEHGLKLLGGSEYQPPHRSPTSIALIQSFEVRDFDLDVDLKQTGRNYGHRDMCLFFGFQSPSRFYYTHMATSPDANAHNIFRVQDEPRTNMSPPAKQGIDWGDGIWHHVHIERRVKDGVIRVYWDDQTEPILSAIDTNFDWGRIGFGSFDDSGIVANIVVRAPMTRSAGGNGNPFAK